MELPNLKQMCDLIRTYTPYTSYTAIAKRLSLSEATLRGYWENYGGHVPDKNKRRFAELVQEIAPIPLTEEAAIDLLRGSPLAFHNILLPIGGATWRELVSEHLAHAPLKIMVPPTPTVRFGEVVEENKVVADATVGLNRPFRIRGRAKWSGEGFLAAEHRGEWHIAQLADGQRSFAFSIGEFDVPPSINGKPRFLTERDKPGYYMYVVIGQKGLLSEGVRSQIHRTNPYSQLDLDVLGSMISQSKQTPHMVLAASLQVTPRPDENVVLEN